MWAWLLDIVVDMIYLTILDSFYINIDINPTRYIDITVVYEQP